MDQYDTAPSVTGDGAGFNAWVLARAGNAIDAIVDRQVRGPQYLNDSGQQFGMDGGGRLYQLGQAGGQVVAQVKQTGPAAINPIFILGLIALVVVMGSK
ncbi:hypothetical protein [Duganella sp. BuS-21]|uniref:hypothetical protein n=1 Tax=Duganella sp. BuS-21 TaxID=2943848 RepID=UPI0035A71F64